MMKLRAILVSLSVLFAFGLVFVPNERAASATTACVVLDCPRCRADGNVDCWDPHPCECFWMWITEQ
jgi:hypothetical protein